MGHVLSSHFNATHGATLSCMMLAWMRYFSARDRNERFRKFSLALFGTDDISQAADRFEHYIKDIGIQTRMRAFGVTPEDIPGLTQGLVDVSFSVDGTLASIPPITREQAERIYEIAL
jgi:alcohol dehydrogenase YqhD (iron-dependent ADH family)